ncbi:MAG: NUDIX hydrolase [Chloroflexi bacterium]|nr:NUDIX hydrolase [Chloroflexota bacterium]
MMKYCPRCGTPLEMKLEGGRERPACPATGCGYFHFGDFSIGCGAVVLRDGKALLIQRGINPGRGSWQIPGGYVESDEEIIPAVEREVREEAGIIARVQEVIGFRHAVAGPFGGTSTNIYVVFRLEPLSGEPTIAGEETMGAGYFSLEEMATMEKMQSLSVWAVQRALALPPGSGFQPVQGSFSMPIRSGWALFGLPDIQGRKG